MQNLSELPYGSKVHLVGICGTAMASLAGLLLEKGYKVTGSDSNPYPPMSDQIEALGIKIKTPYAASNISEDINFAIIGNVISSTNSEAQEIIRRQIPYTSLPRAIGEIIIEDRNSVVISGTHGKTTTTSMAVWAFDQLKLNPGYLVGGIPKNFSKSFKIPQSDWFIIEGDEYDTAFFDKVPKFIHYRPSHVILTSIEFDHADIYKDLDHVKSAFRSLLRLIPQRGLLLYWNDCENIKSIISDAEKVERIFSYGIESGDYLATDIKENQNGQNFMVYFKDQKIGQFFLPMSGQYNILNYLAVIALAHQENLDLRRLSEVFSDFKGVKRRQEILGEVRGALIIEDFAHHPTAVKETLDGIKKRYSNRRLIAIFEPRSATSRRKIFQKKYIEAFNQSDLIFISEAFDQSKINEQDRFSSAELVQDLVRNGKSCFLGSGADDILDQLSKYLEPKDVIVIMSNGGFDGIYKKIFQRLK